jgi:sulfide dehydrogenase cytochrome subunit
MVSRGLHAYSVLAIVHLSKTILWQPKQSSDKGEFMMRPKKNSVVFVALAVVPLLFASGEGFAADGPAAATPAANAVAPAAPAAPTTSASAVASAPAIPADPAKQRERGQILALSCSGCHGTDGKSTSVIPSIYGKTTGYIESALRDFKSGARSSTVMSRHAKGYTDDEIHLIAEYFGNLSKKQN